MKKTIAFSAVIALSLGLCSLGLSGCSSPSESESSASNEHSEHAHGEHGDSDGMTDMEKMKVELAKLSPEDAASAEKQHLCPVSGDMLGAVGAPIKIDVEGQEVWICCEGCRDPLLEDPAKYLAKLKG